MASTLNMRSLLRALPTARPTTTSSLLPHRTPTNPTALRALSTTPPLAARMTKKAKPPKPTSKRAEAAAMAARTAARKRRAAQNAALDPKVSAVMHFLYAPTQTSAPLRFGRNRALRHWTIHRAWQLLQRQRKEQLHTELTQMQQCMANACEALRNLEGPGTRPEGWLFRKSMEKVGVWGMQAVPIEYARPMVETPGDRPWNHDWKRA